MTKPTRKASRALPETAPQRESLARRLSHAFKRKTKNVVPKFSSRKSSSLASTTHTAISTSPTSVASATALVVPPGTSSCTTDKGFHKMTQSAKPAVAPSAAATATATATASVKSPSKTNSPADSVAAAAAMETEVENRAAATSTSIHVPSKSAVVENTSESQIINCDETIGRSSDKKVMDGEEAAIKHNSEAVPTKPASSYTDWTVVKTAHQTMSATTSSSDIILAVFMMLFLASFLQWPYVLTGLTEKLPNQNDGDCQ